MRNSLRVVVAMVAVVNCENAERQVPKLEKAPPVQSAGAQREEAPKQVEARPAPEPPWRLRVIGTRRKSQWQFNVGVEMENQTDSPANGRVCVRLYDEQGMELHDGASEEMPIGAGESSVVTAAILAERHELREATLLRAYASRFGCIDSPSEALSRVVEADFSPK